MGLAVSETVAKLCQNTGRFSRGLSVLLSRLLSRVVHRWLRGGRGPRPTYR